MALKEHFQMCVEVICNLLFAVYKCLTSPPSLDNYQVTNFTSTQDMQQIRGSASTGQRISEIGFHSTLLKNQDLTSLIPCHNFANQPQRDLGAFEFYFPLYSVTKQLPLLSFTMNYNDSALTFNKSFSWQFPQTISLTV